MVQPCMSPQSLRKQKASANRHVVPDAVNQQVIRLPCREQSKDKKLQWDIEKLEYRRGVAYGKGRRIKLYGLSCSFPKQ